MVGHMELRKNPEEEGFDAFWPSGSRKDHHSSCSGKGKGLEHRRTERLRVEKCRCNKSLGYNWVRESFVGAFLRWMVTGQNCDTIGRG